MEVAVVASLTIVVNPAAGGGRAIRHLPAVRTVLDAGQHHGLKVFRFT